MQMEIRQIVRHCQIYKCMTDNIRLLEAHFNLQLVKISYFE